MISKRYKALPQETKKLKNDTIENLIGTVKKNCTTNFDESIDVNFQLNLRQKKSETNLRTIINLPVGNNKKIKVAVICEEEKLEEAKKSKADVIGSDDLVNNISAGEINFDKLNYYIKKFNHSSKKDNLNIINFCYKRNPEKINVGFVSPDFRSHPVGYALTNVIEHLKSYNFNLFGYYNFSFEDDLTNKFKKDF